VWWTRRRGGKGRIRLPEPGEGNRSGVQELLISIPWFVIGVVGAVVAWAKDVEIPFLSERLRRNSRSGYRTVRLDDAMDAELLGKLLALLLLILSVLIRLSRALSR